MVNQNGSRFLLGTAVVGSAVGLVLVVEPGIAPNAPFGYILLLLIAGGATVFGFKLLQARRQIDVAFFDPPAPEYRAILEVPGQDFDADLSSRNPGVRDRLRAATVTYLVQVTDHDRESAQAAIEDGSWTDNSKAAAFFSNSAGQNQRSFLIGSEAQHVISQAIEVITELADQLGYDHSFNEVAEPETIMTFPPHRAEESDSKESLMPSPGTTIQRETKRWRGVSVFVLLAAAIGIITTQPSLLLIAGFGGVVIVYTGVWRSLSIPDVDLDVERTISPENPRHGEEVSVSVVIRNDGDRLLPDIRFIDGVPAGLCVSKGSPRRGAFLRAGERTSFSYTLEAEYGEHTFQAPVVVAYDVCGEREQLTRLLDHSEDMINCGLAGKSPHERASVESRALTKPGNVSADTGGRGIEFYTTREYRQGDPPSLVDWNRLARTGELATIEFNRQHASAALFLIDARRPAHVAQSYWSPSAVDRSRMAAAVTSQSLIERDDLVGVMAISPKPCRLPSNGGKQHLRKVNDVLKSHPALTTVPSENEHTYVSTMVQNIRHLTRSNPHIIIFSPLIDDFVNTLAGRLIWFNYPITVVSPDVTSHSTPGTTLTKIERDLRIAALQTRGIHVIDWAEDERIMVAMNQSPSTSKLRGCK